MRTTGKLKIDYGVDWMKAVSEYFLGEYGVDMHFEHGRGDQDVLHIYAKYVDLGMSVSCKIFGGELWDLIKLASVDALILAIEREIGYNLKAISEANTLVAPSIKNLRKLIEPLGYGVQYSFITGAKSLDTLFLQIECDGFNVEKRIALVEFYQSTIPVDYVLMDHVGMSISDLLGTYGALYLK